MKIKKLQIIIIFILVFIAVLVVIYTWAKYVIIKNDSHVQNAEEFYFNSNILNENSPIYYAKDWNGMGIYTISIDLNNYEDAIRKTNTNIDYEVFAESNNPNVIVTLSEQEGTINVNETKKTIRINLEIDSNSSLVDR